jgi:hypothetical protein
MADQTEIKEYFVNLGFSVDEQSLQRFSTAVVDATRSMGRLIDAVEQLSSKVVSGIAGFAADLEGLYFESERLGSSANKLKATYYAAGDFGVSSTDVRGALQGLADAVRKPEGEQSLEGLGIQPRDVSGALRDTTDLLLELGRRLKDVPWPQAHDQASALGVNDNTLRAAQAAGFAEKVAIGQDRYGGLDQETANNAHEFMTSLRDIGAQFDDLTIRVQSALEEKLGPDLQHFSEWFAENEPLIAHRIAEVVVAIIDLAEKSGPYLDKLSGFLVQLDQDTEGWSSNIIVLLGLLGKLGGSSLIGGIARLGGRLLGLGGGIGAVGAAGLLIKGDTSQSSGEAQKLETAAHAGSRDAAEQLARIQLNNNPFNHLFGLITDEDVRRRADGILSRSQVELSVPSKAAALPSSINSVDDRFVRGVSSGGGRKPTVLEQWSVFEGSGRGADLILPLGKMQRRLREGAELKAAMLLQASQNADVTDNGVPDYYRWPAESTFSGTSPGAATVQLTQTTHINVLGAGDPLGTGNAVSDAQARINQDLVRNLSGAVN